MFAAKNAARQYEGQRFWQKYLTYNIVGRQMISRQASFFAVMHSYFFSSFRVRHYEPLYQFE